MTRPDNELFEFDSFRLDPAERLLLRDGKPVPLEPKVFETLLVLIRRGGRLVGKDELMQTVWPDSFVEESNMTRNISVLRKTLHRSDGGPQYIETVPKRGYRFVGEVQALPRQQAEVIVQSSKVSVVVEEEECDGETKGEDNRGTGRALRDSGGPTAIEWKQQSLGNLKQHKLVVLMTLATLTAAAAVYFFTRGKVSDPQTSTAPIDSIAVLPFENTAQDPNAEYLSDGITENLINSLSQIPKLRVVPRGRVFRYKGREIDTEKVGRELNVRAVLTGRVVQRGDSLNIQSELVDVAADSQLWGRQYERKFSEIVPVQEEIAREVSEKLHLRPTGEEQRRLTKRYTENPEAHQLYLKGRYLWNRRTTETLRRAAEYFQKATDKDPSYALAWAGLAECYAVYPAFSVLPPREAIPKAKEAAIKALAFDDTVAEAHTALAYVKNTYDWDWPGAEQEFKRAIKLNPNYATAHFWYAIHLQAMGRLDEAIAEAKLAQEADPVSPIIGLLAGRTFYVARRYDQAIEQLHKALEMDPHFPRAHWWLAKAYEQVGRHEEAVAESQKAVSLSAGEPTYFGQLGHAYAVSGKKTEAQKVLAELKDLSKRRYVAPFDIALVYMGLGDKSRALEWLEKAYEDHSDWLAWIKVWPQFDSLRGEPRFQDLLRRLGLPQ